MSTSPLRIDLSNTKKMSSACTGWSCVCQAPYGFGDDRNKICKAYGPSSEAHPEDVKHHNENKTGEELRAIKKRRAELTR